MSYIYGALNFEPDSYPYKCPKAPLNPTPHTASEKLKIKVQSPKQAIGHGSIHALAFNGDFIGLCDPSEDVLKVMF